MWKVIRILIVLIGGALAAAGFLRDSIWLASGGGVLFLIGAIVWIAVPPKPTLFDGGNRPTHDPINQTGPPDD